MIFKFKRNTYKNKIKLELKLFGKTIKFIFKFRKRPENIIQDMEALQKNASKLAVKHLQGKVCIAMYGRLGNQMFIHAASKNLLKNTSTPNLLYDISLCDYVLNKYNINIETTNIKYDNLLNDKYKVSEKRFGIYEPDFFYRHGIYYKGAFQIEDYFKEYRDILIEEFRAKMPFTEEYLIYLDKIENSNSVLLNFRVEQDYKNLGWVLDFDYQKKAMEYIISKIDNPKFFVFADNIEYVKENFKTDYELDFVDIGKENSDKVYLDLELMKKCKHAIIPNSTFSWWAAWLNENPQKIIIAPDPWLFNESEVVPKDWVKIKAEKVYCENPHIV